MKIWRKSTLAALFLFCTMFFALSMTAAAEEIGGVWKKDEMYGKIDVSWSYDTETKTLTISGTGSYFKAGVSAPWQEYVDDVDVFIVNGDTASYCWPKKRIIANVGNGFQWIYDIETQNIVFSHQGGTPEPFPNAAYTHGKIPKEINLATVEDGVTSIDNVLNSSHEIDTIVFGKDVQAPSERTFRVKTKYSVDKDNPWITAYDDCLYTKDYQRLIGCPLNEENIKFRV